MDHGGNIAVMAIIFQDPHSGKKAKDSRDCLPGGFFVYEVRLCSIDRKGAGIPDLPVVIQSGGINGPGLSNDHIRKAEKTCQAGTVFWNLQTCFLSAFQIYHRIICRASFF